MKGFTFAVVLLCSSCAWAWPTCSGNWVGVPSGTSTANGAVVTENGQTFQCQVPKPPTTTPTNVTNTNTSASNSTSASNATGGNASATATGGNVNSTNTNNNISTNTLSQTQKQQQSQTQSNSSTNSNQSSATGGNNSNNSTEVTNVKVAAATAYAPTSLPSAPCTKSFGAGVSSIPGGLSFGGNKVDAGCDARELARSFSLTGSRIAACKVLIATKRAKQAKVTLDDCMQTPPPQAEDVTFPISAPVSQPIAQPVQVTVTLPPAQLIYLSPREETTVTAPKPLGDAKPASKKHVAKPCKIPPSLQSQEK